ncbi:MAG: hypothetical protein GYA17_14685, partial [Chloroflexi bacterium]|nr:hypothetical protein [Chloroflexota bacterium]
LEHATLSVLARKNARRSLAGYSDLRGFWIIGSLSTEELQQAVDEALSRLKSGEYGLSIHPNCGTNFATSGVLAGSAAFLALLGSGRSLRSKLDRLPMAITLATAALVVAQPIGPWLQARVTTEGRVGELKVVEIMRYQRSDRSVPMHRVSTRI